MAFTFIWTQEAFRFFYKIWGKKDKSFKWAQQQTIFQADQQIKEKENHCEKLDLGPLSWNNQ